MARIQFSLTKRAKVSLVVYDINGRKIRVLAEGTYSPGLNVTTWDGANSAGSEVSAGIYVVTLRAGESLQSSKIVHLK